MLSDPTPFPDFEILHGDLTALSCVEQLIQIRIHHPGIDVSLGRACPLIKSVFVDFVQYCSFAPEPLQSER